MKRRLQTLLGNAVKDCIDKKLIDVEAVPDIEIDIDRKSVV